MTIASILRRALRVLALSSLTLVALGALLAPAAGRHDALATADSGVDLETARPAGVH